MLQSSKNVCHTCAVITLPTLQLALEDIDRLLQNNPKWHPSLRKDLYILVPNQPVNEPNTSRSSRHIFALGSSRTPGNRSLNISMQVPARKRRNLQVSALSTIEEWNAVVASSASKGWLLEIMYEASEHMND